MPSTSQCSEPPTRTAPLAKRCTSCSSSVPGPTSPTMTRPEVAPRSTAATRTVRGVPAVPVIADTSSQEGRRHARVDRDVQAGGVREVGAAEHEHRVGDVLRQHLALEDRALRVELAEVLLLDAVDRGAVRAPAAGEDPGALHHAVGVDPVDLDAVLAELGGQQPDLVRL